MENKKSLIASTLTSGIIFGIALVLYSLIIYIFDIDLFGVGKSMINLLVTIGIVFACLFIFTKKTRDEVYGGVANYGKLLVVGILISAFAGLVNAIYNYVFVTIIDENYLEMMFNKTVEFTTEMLEKRGVPEDAMDAAIERIEAKGIPSVFKAVRQAFMSTLIFGFIISLITSAIHKRDEVKLDMEQAASAE